MKSNYEQIKQQIRRYSFEKLKVSKEPEKLFEKLYDEKPEMIENAVKPALISAAVIYSYLRENKLNGKNGISVKDLAKYFEVNAQGISSKVFDVDCIVNRTAIFPDEPFEFIDEDRYAISTKYYEFIESSESNDFKKSEKVLKSFISKDPLFFDSYTSLHEYYLNERKTKKAFDLMMLGYNRAMGLVEKNGNFPDALRWGFIENRHIIRLLFNFAILLWLADQKEETLNIMLQLLKSNPNDNIGARYSIIALLEGFESQEHLDEYFDAGNGNIDWEKQEKWFLESSKKHKNIIGWWFELNE